jgi:hypothetical protein
VIDMQTVEQKLTRAMKVKPLITWLKKQPAETSYNYADQRGCLLARYLKSKGFSRIWVGGWTCKIGGAEFDIPYALQEIASGDDTGSVHTYGQALTRAVASSTESVQP